MTFSLYLTGVPAIGKSSIATELEARTDALRLSYGEILTRMLADRVKSQTELRERSASVISPADVAGADEWIKGELCRLSGLKNTVVDSHALTAESYGLRAVPYRADELTELPFTHIVCLTGPHATVRERVQLNALGRRAQDETDMGLHQSLQSSLALSYAITLGVPVAFIRADRPLGEVTADILRFVGYA
ncbi:AAA family ATPase [Microbacterium pygmaeum]|uniref:Adenylate kinase n=1 Tax=Microbacterium pygmaeum TaxID=370764 RepID=A0A1G7YG57_9MICO|nr:AAA family ATPase [Microbacterium pygmaeum]SDG95327.1 adenylate kinase [Microbacterium pygmaeum]